MPSTSQTTTTQNTQLVNDTTVSTGSYNSPYMRPRTLVISASNLKPNSLLFPFMSGVMISQNFQMATEIVISPNNVRFTEYLGSTKSNDNLSTGARNGIGGFYDILEYGEVIRCATGTAVVIADDTVYNYSTRVNERIIYVCNVKGTISGTITGSLSNSSGTVLSVRMPVDIKANSLGNLYGVVHVPPETFRGGTHKITFTESWQNESDIVDSFASSAYYTNGKINTFTRTQTYSNTTTVHTVTNASESRVTEPPMICTPGVSRTNPAHQYATLYGLDVYEKCNSSGTQWVYWYAVDPNPSSDGGE